MADYLPEGVRGERRDISMEYLLKGGEKEERKEERREERRRGKREGGRRNSNYSRSRTPDVTIRLA